MSDIYEQHRAAFANVSAYVVMSGADRVATVAFKFGGAVTAYVHWIGDTMTRGRAGGGGYDRQSAACRDATRKADAVGRYDGEDVEKDAMRAKFRAAMLADDGHDWRRRLEDAGFKVFSAV